MTNFIHLKRQLGLLLQILWNTRHDAWKRRLLLAVCRATQLDYRRLDHCIETVRALDRRGINGAIVECGVWRGGSSAVLGVVAEAERRMTWLFDSFAGMPEGTPADVGPNAALLTRGRTSGRLVPVGTNVATKDVVEQLLFQRLHLSRDRVRIIPGWFQETLPEVQRSIGPIALLRIDADFYASTKVCLEELFPLVVSGGSVIIDDYGLFPGCKRATDEFFLTHARTTGPTPVSSGAVVFQVL